MMKKKLLFIALLLVGMTAVCAAKKEKGKFVKVDGVNLVKPNGEKLFIVGTNLGNWLNPEGYMFGFRSLSRGLPMPLWCIAIPGPC